MRALKWLFLFGLAAAISACYPRIAGSTPGTMAPSLAVSQPPDLATYPAISSITPPSITPPLELTDMSTPTAVPTFNYKKLASRYLTPAPTSTPRTDLSPTWTPSPTTNSLQKLITRKLPAGWTSTPPALMPFYDIEMGTPWPQNPPDFKVGYIQAATDLMNFTDADQSLFLKSVDAWTPAGRSDFGEAWLLKDDFDGDGKPEWLVSIPMYSEDSEASYNRQLIILFEKNGDRYQPMHYDEKVSDIYATEVLFVGDLQKDGHKEIVLRTVTCGSACGQDLEIGRWDGANWTNDHIGSEVTDFISFVDYYNDGRIEIIINYHTQYKFDGTYPDRLATDIYGWKNGKLSLLGESRSPNTEPYAVMRDVFSAIYEGKIDDALKLAQPTLDKIPKTCAEMETYTAIEVMLAQAVKNQPGAMQATLAQINTYCAQPDNGFTAAANILWQAYQQVHDPALACEAMDRFIVEQNSSYNQNSSFKFFGQDMNASDLYYGSGFCPFQRQ